MGNRKSHSKKEGVKMRKRKNSDEEDSEMEVEGEEKIEHMEEDDESSTNSEDEDAAPVQARDENPFLDSFYGLSSEDPRDRSQAAQTMLDHCLLGPSSNTKDACYAFRRLLNGLCSGRAAARQGNASALASFLKIGFHLDKMEDIQTEMTEEGATPISLLAFVRERLIVATDHSQTTGKKKGSEERDYQFGRLFGILGIVRSSILLPTNDGGKELSDIMDVSSALVSDLTELFWHKKWIREPAAHGITTLLKLFYDGKVREDCNKIVHHLVEHVVVPKVLAKDDESNHNKLLESYCAEQIGIASYIQSQVHVHDDGLPFPLDKPILSSETVPLIGQALSDTSVVVQPRTHFVWDTVWSYLTETHQQQKTKNAPSQRRLRAKCPVGGGSTVDVIEALVRVVIMEKLLRLDQEKVNSASKATHERRSLSLCMIKHLSGVPFVSSISGVTQILLDQDVLESIILTPSIVRSLFLDVICAGSQKKQSTHLLKPLALDVLGSMTEAVTEHGENIELSKSRQLTCIRAFLNCEIRFDARTKTSTVTDLLCFKDPIQEGMASKMFAFWNDYLGYLETQLLTKSADTDENDSSAEATGYVELLYSAGKSILRLEAESDTDKTALKEYKETVVHRILGFFMASAFFKCDNIESAEKGGGKKSGQAATPSPILESALKIRGCDGITYAVRSIVSARFFSLVSDFAHHRMHEASEDHEGKVEKDTMTLSILTQLCDDWKLMESSGAERYICSTGNEEEEDEPVDPSEIVNDIRNQVKDLTESLDKDSENSVIQSKKRCCTGIAVLAYTLYLHRLTCGNQDGTMDNDDPDADEEDDEEEICNALEGLKDVMEDFTQASDEESNPLLGLAQLCANILSSPLGSGNIGRGASPKLVREAVKFSWLGGLRLSSEMATEERTLLDDGVIGILLEAIGAPIIENSDEDGSDDGEDSDDDDEDSDASEDSGDDIVFSKASNLLDDSEDMDVDKSEDKAGKEEDSDVELDASNLQSLLEEDSDAGIEVDQLEHHEGADAALAKLIKLKQYMRKAGQQAREKIEMSHQLRCSFLIELMISRPDAWNRLFRTDVILKMVVPMLTHRKKIEKSLAKASDSGPKSGAGEKKALLDRLTALLTHKLCKMRLSSMPLVSSVDLDFASNLVSEVITEAKHSASKEHASCCSSCLVFVLRSIPDTQDALSVASACAEAVKEWSTKRTQLGSTLFDELIVHTPR